MSRIDWPISFWSTSPGSNEDCLFWMTTTTHRMAFSDFTFSFLSLSQLAAGSQCNNVASLPHYRLCASVIRQDRIVSRSVFWLWFACYGPARRNHRWSARRLYRTQAHYGSSCPSLHNPSQSKGEISSHLLTWIIWSIWNEMRWKTNEISPSDWITRWERSFDLLVITNLLTNPFHMDSCICSPCWPSCSSAGEPSYLILNFLPVKPGRSMPHRLRSKLCFQRRSKVSFPLCGQISKTLQQKSLLENGITAKERCEAGMSL